MNSIKEVKVTIAGGGSTYTAGIVISLLHHDERLKLSSLRLYDNDLERATKMSYLIRGILNQYGKGSLELIVTDNPEIAFTGSDFVFSQIRVGGLKMREKDEKIPLSYGVVGQETCGPGGFSYGMRSLSGFLPLVEKIIEYAPDAWILNYTNPESIIAEGVRRLYPNAKIINVCDMTIAIEETICENFGYDRNDFICEYYGLNHFGWYRKIYSKKAKKDILPEILKKIRNQEMDVADFNEGDTTWIETYKMLTRLVEYFPGYLPNTYLQYYLFPDKVIEKANPNHTRANIVMEGRERHIFELAEKAKNNPTAKDLRVYFGSHGDYIVDIATSILHDEHRRFMIIVPNNGAIPNLRHDSVVEVPAYIGATGVEAVSLDPIPDFHKGLLEAQCAAEKLLVDAYFEGSYTKALEAFTLNQAVPNATVAKQILDEFIEVNKGYWPELHD